MLESILAEIIAGAILATFGASWGYLAALFKTKKRIENAPRKYAERIGEIILKAYTDGKENCLVNARSIVVIRNSLRGSLNSAAGLLNSEIDRLSMELGQSYFPTVPDTIQPENKSPNIDAIWDTIQVLHNYWPTKQEQLEYEISKILVDLDLLGGKKK